jgi:hypothetical protein
MRPAGGGPISLPESVRGITHLLPMLLCLGVMACGDTWSLAISAGAPVTIAVRGTIFDCGKPVAGAEVLLLVQQDQPGQSRPVDADIGPVTTTLKGSYLLEVGPAFAVPGPASMQLRVTSAGVTREIPGGTLELRMGLPPRDTTRFDVDLGAERGAC